MKDLKLNSDWKPGHQVTSRSQASTDDRKGKTETHGAIAFQLYGVGKHNKERRSGPFHLYGVEKDQMGNRRLVAVRLYGVGKHNEEHRLGPFHLYGAGMGQTD